MGPNLKLRATDAADLTVMAAALQDAIVPIQDLGHVTADDLFVMVVNRFMWETEAQSEEGHFGSDEAAAGAPLYFRTNCGVRFRHVTQVRSRNVDLQDRRRMLNLLNLEARPEGLGLVFADGADIALACGRIDIWLEDVGEPWPTRRRPDHAEPAGAPKAD